MNNEDIIIIVICYFNAYEVIDYHKKVVKLDTGENVPYIVVVNGANDSELELLERYEMETETVYVFNPNENLGYYNGLIYGYLRYQEQTGSVPNYVVMSNTDIDYTQNDFFTILRKRAYTDDVWCIGPSIFVKEYKSYDNPVSRERYEKKYIESLIRRFSIPIFRELYVIAAFLKPKFFKRRKDLKSGKAYELHGCFFILTGDAVEYLKKQKYGVLLYSEETFIAEHIFRMKKSAFYDSGLEVVHLEHSTTSKLRPTERAARFAESMRYIKCTFFDD